MVESFDNIKLGCFLNLAREDNNSTQWVHLNNKWQETEVLFLEIVQQNRFDIFIYQLLCR